MEDTIQPVSYQITYVAESKYHIAKKSPIYDIKGIDQLASFIKNQGINTIYQIDFQFKIYKYSYACFVYYVIKNNDNTYSFAPCYNYKTYEPFLQEYKSDMINILMNTIIKYSSDIKEVFTDRIDQSQEIIHKFTHDDDE